MLIGITGKKGTGKDTVGQYLVDNYEFRRLAFADKLKEAVANLLGIDINEVDALKNPDELWRVEIVSHQEQRIFSELSWREFLQRFGTEMGRNTFGQNFWIDCWQDAWTTLSVLEPDIRNVVATDVRFNNEAHHIHFCGGYVIEIVRDGYEPDGHASEEGIDELLVDALITNNGTIEDLYKDVDQLMKDVTSGA